MASHPGNSTASGAGRPSRNFGGWLRTRIARGDVHRSMLGSGVDLGLEQAIGARRDIHTRTPTPTSTATGGCAGPASWSESAPDGWPAQRTVLKDIRTTGPTPPMTLVGTAVVSLPACRAIDPPSQRDFVVTSGILGVCDCVARGLGCLCLSDRRRAGPWPRRRSWPLPPSVGWHSARHGVD